MPVLAIELPLAMELIMLDRLLSMVVHPLPGAKGHTLATSEPVAAFWCGVTVAVILCGNQLQSVASTDNVIVRIVGSMPSCQGV